jgi:hypothetical protein
MKSFSRYSERTVEALYSDPLHSLPCSLIVPAAIHCLLRLCKLIYRIHFAGMRPTRARRPEQTPS